MPNVVKRGGTYTIRISAGYDIKGRQFKRNFTWVPSPGLTPKQEEKELVRQVALFEEKVRTGRIVNGSIKFSAFSERWLKEYAEKQLAPKTIHRYKDLLVRINLSIGHIRLEHLQPINLIEFYDNLSASGIRSDKKYTMNDKFIKELTVKNLKTAQLAKMAGIAESTAYNIVLGNPASEKSAEAISIVLNKSIDKCFSVVNKSGKLSPRTILAHHRLISSILETAVQWQAIFSNPADRLKAPKVKRTESSCLDDVQAIELIKLLDNESIQNKTMIISIIYTGLRRGELCGLKWSDVDFENKVLHVRRALQYLPEVGIFEKEPKSSSSMRAIKISDAAILLLMKYKVWQNEEKLKLGDLWQKEARKNYSNRFSDFDFLFTSWDGSPIRPDYITHWFRLFNRKHGLPDVNIHSLRHTNATLMIAAGTDIRTVSKRLGHAQTSTTTNIYAHAIRSADEAAAETIQNILDPRNLLAKKVQNH
jgi:integrase